MPNKEFIDTIVDRSGVSKQVKDTISELEALDKQLIDTAASANALNTALGRSTGTQQLTQNSTAAAQAVARLTTAQNQAQISAIRLQNAQNAQAATLARQAAAANKATGEYAKLKKAYEEATLAARNAGAAFGVNSIQFRITAENANRLRTQLDAIDQPLGNFQRNVGNYGSAITQAFSRAYGAIRTVANILPGLGISGVFLLIYQGLKLVIDQLGLFNTALSETEIKQKSFQSAISGDGYKEAVKNITELRVNLDLAKQGFIDKDKVIDEYNESIGKVTGNVDTLDEAERGLAANADKFIKATLLKAAAEIVLADASKEAAETALKNQKLQDDIDDSRNNRFTAARFFSGAFNAGNSQSQNAAERIKKDQEEIEANNKKLKATFDNRLKVIQNFDKQQVDLLGKNANPPGTSAGGPNSGVAIINNRLANADLEYNKNIQKQTMDDTKRSYSDRLKASDQYYYLQKRLLENNKNLAIADTTLSNNQQLAIIKEFTNSYQQAEQEQEKNRKALQSDANKDRIALYQQDLTSQKKVEQDIIADQTASLDLRLNTVKSYVKTASELAKVSAKLEIAEAGDNSDKIKTVRKKLQGDLADIDKEGKTKTFEINKQAQDALIKSLVQGAKYQEDLEKETIALFKQEEGKRLLIIEQNSAEAQEALGNQLKKGTITQSQYNYQKEQIDRDSADDSIKQQIITAQAIVDLQRGLLTFGIGSARDLGKSEQDLAKLKIQASKQATAQQLADAKTVADARKSQHDLEIQLTDQVLDFTKTAIDAGFQHRLDSLKSESDQIDKNTQSQLDAVSRSVGSEKQKADQTALINAKAQQQKDIIAQKERKIQHDQAVFDKAFNIAKALESVSLSEVKALDYLTNPLTAPLYPAIAALIGAIGAVNVATIIAQPIPAFKDGIRDKNAAGLGIWGEAGIELGVMPDGRAVLSPDKATLDYMPKGMDIFSHAELMRMISKPDLPVYAGGKEVDVQSLISESKRSTSRLETAFSQREKVLGFSVNSSRRARWEAYKKRNLN